MMKYIQRYWRGFLARLPLPTLALAASYGVYSFALLFVPWWVAVVQAASFESTYIGLAVVDVPEQDRRKRARKISLAAVTVSVVYNSLAGFFHRNPSALLGLPWYEEMALAIAHGAPLAIVAYLVADLLLHTSVRATEHENVLELPEYEPVLQSATRNGDQSYRCQKCGASGFSFDELGRHSQRCKGGV